MARPMMVADADYLFHEIPFVYFRECSFLREVPSSTGGVVFYSRLLYKPVVGKHVP